VVTTEERGRFAARGVTDSQEFDEIRSNRKKRGRKSPTRRREILDPVSGRGQNIDNLRLRDSTGKNGTGSFSSRNLGRGGPGRKLDL